MNDDWKSQEIRDAEAAFEEALANAERALAEADRFSASVPDGKLSEEQVAQVEELVRAGKAPDEIKALQERIDEGELSWDDIANGRGIDDPTVQQAFTAGTANMKEAKELLDEGHSIDEMIAADPNRPSTGDSGDEDEPGSLMDNGKW
ncbi:hypothetical protein [Parasphingorhabdus pacifica]